jgi:methylglutaconyl-CoA hydratase
MGHARALFVTGRRFDFVEAHRIGLLQQVGSLEETIEGVLQAAPDAVARAKKLLQEIAQGSADTAAAIAGARASAQGREGLSAFLEKRKPDWVPQQ